MNDSELQTLRSVAESIFAVALVTGQVLALWQGRQTHRAVDGQSKMLQARARRQGRASGRLDEINDPGGVGKSPTRRRKLPTTE